jgi:hypothetical protein
VLHYQRLHLLANNARFLILPGVQVANLASRVLALNLRRLSADWRRVHGHPLLLAETFVDTARFTGACYRGANWQVLGSTRGFARHNGRYSAHGVPKQVLIYPLHPRARALLCAPELPPAWSTPMQRVSLSPAQMEDLHQRLRALPDHRHARGQRHRLATVLTLAIAAVLAGSRGYTAIAEWAARLTQPQLKRLRARFNPRTERFEPPSEPTIRRILQSGDVARFDASLSEWLLGHAQADEAVAGSRDRRARGLLGACAPQVRRGRRGAHAHRRRPPDGGADRPALRHRAGPARGHPAGAQGGGTPGDSAPLLEKIKAWPRRPIDNNLAENAIRPFVVGRKGWLFSGSPRGAHASATLYSLIETAKANALEPRAYLHFLFERLPEARTPEAITALLPQNLKSEDLKL